MQVANLHTLFEGCVKAVVLGAHHQGENFFEVRVTYLTKTGRKKHVRDVVFLRGYEVTTTVQLPGTTRRCPVL